MALLTNWCRDMFRSSVKHKATFKAVRYDNGMTLTFLKGNERIGRVTIMNGESMKINLSPEEVEHLVSVLAKYRKDDE